MIVERQLQDEQSKMLWTNVTYGTLGKFSEILVEFVFTEFLGLLPKILLQKDIITDNFQENI